jgi:hypothetical protein
MTEINIFLLFAAKYSVRGISLTPPSDTSYAVDAIPQLFAKDTGHLGVNYVAVDYDAEEKMVYFSDIRNFAIMKAKVDGSISKNLRQFDSLTEVVKPIMCS